MTEKEDTRRKSRRDLLLVLLILPFGVLCMFMTGQVAIRLAPTWILNADMRSLLDPNAQFNAGGIPVYIEPLDPGILTLPAWGDLFLTPNAAIPTRLVPTATPLPARTPLPPPPPTARPDEPEPTATVPGPIVFPTQAGPLLADLVIEKSDNSATYTPGTAIHYTIHVTNLGPDTALRFNVIDEVPAMIGGLTATCAPAERCGTNTSSGNTVSFTGANLPPSGTNQITISVSGTVSPGATGRLSNTAELVIPSGARFRDPNLSNNSVTDMDRQLSIYDLAITKSDGIDTFTATTPIIYTVVVTNSSGPSDALGVRVTDNKPPQVSSWTWTCTTVTNASGCNGVTNSANNFTDSVIVRVGGRIEYTVSATLAALSQNPQTLSNTANVLLPSGTGFIDPNLSNNSATDIATPYIDLRVTKTDGVTIYTPPGPLTYTITVTNNSTFNLTGITISDPKPAQVTTWSWTCAGGCTQVVNSNANFTDTINLTAGASLVYTVTANLSGATGAVNLSNTVTVSPPAGLVDAVPADNSATDVDSPYIDLQITKTDGVTTYSPGGSLQYLVTVTNNSAFSLTGVSVTDAMPALISSWTWTCTPDPGASCTPGPSNANINDTAVNLSAGASVTYTIDAVVSPAAAGDLSNTAMVSPPAGFVDAVPGNNTAMDTNTRQVEYISTLGPPNGDILFVPFGTSMDFTLTTPITIDGNTSDFEIVFYEWEQSPRNEIDLDQVIISIGNGINWYVVYYWGDNLIDTNASPPGALSEPDNYPISTSLLYGSPYQTGILIDADGGKERPLNGTYQFIRVTAPPPPGDTDGGCDIDSIGIWP